MPKTIQLEYYAALREKRGCAQEAWETEAATARAVYAEIQQRYGFHLTPDQVRVVINDEFAPWDTPVHEADRVVFIPPVAGG